MNSNFLLNQKQKLRQEMLQKRREVFAVSLENSPSWGQSVVDFLKKAGLEPPAQISGYWPTGSEFDLRPLLLILHQRGFSCSLPVVQSHTRVLQFYPWVPETSFILGEKGILVPENQTAPQTPDILFLPLVAFDAQGNRLGQGGGYFDATLKKYRAEKRTFAFGVGFENQASESVPHGLEDEKIDGILTEKGLRFLA